MKVYLTIIVLLCSIICYAQDSLSYNQESIERQILEDLNNRLADWYSGNGAGYLTSFEEDLTYFDPFLGGKRILTLEELKVEANSRDTKWEFYGIEEPIFQHGDNQIVLTFSLKQSFLGGKDLYWSATEVFRVTDGDFKMIHAHWSPYGPGLAQVPSIFLQVGGAITLILGLTIGFFLGKRRRKSA